MKLTPTHYLEQLASTTSREQISKTAVGWPGVGTSDVALLAPGLHQPRKSSGGKIREGQIHRNAATPAANGSGWKRAY